ncbi:MAG: hypothetical protein AAF570_29020, partial [Bacteroidota bacterium]
LGYEAASYTGRLDAGRRIYTQAMARATSKTDRARLELSRARVAISASDLGETLDACRAGLNLINIRVPAKAGRMAVIVEFLRTRWMLRGKSSEDLYNLPIWKGVEGALMSELLYLSLHPAYVSSPELFAVLSLKTLQASIRNGLSRNAILGFSTYGIFLAVGTSDFKKAYEIVDLGSRISARLGNDGAMVNSVRGFARAFGRHIREGFPFADKSHRQADELGMLREAAEVLPWHTANRFHASLPLSEMIDKIQYALTYIARTGIGHLYESVVVLLDQISKMAEIPVSLKDIDGNPLSNEALDAMLYKSNYLTTRAYYKVLQMQMAFMRGDLDRANALLDEILPIEHSVA